MTEYLTTREVASLLRLNEKKVYDMVAKGQLPAARISGKWIFPLQLVEQWVERHTLNPASGLMGTLIDDLLVIQGSDDWLFGQVAAGFQEQTGLPVASARVGSLSGISAIGAGKAHLAGCHVENRQLEELAGDSFSCYLVNLLQRTQGLMFDPRRHERIEDLTAVGERNLRFAQRQPLSGTYKLTERLCRERGIDMSTWSTAGPYSSHLDLAMAVRRGLADVGVGIQVAAELCELGFVPVADEAFKLAIPTELGSHSQIARFIDYTIQRLKTESHREVPGYGFEELGKIEVIGKSLKGGSS